MEELEAALQIWHRARSADGREPEDARVERVRAKLSDPSAVTVLIERRAQFVGMGVAESFREHLGLGESHARDGATSPWCSSIPITRESG